MPEESRRIALLAMLAADLAEVDPERARRIANQTAAALLVKSRGLEAGAAFTFAEVYADIDADYAARLIAATNPAATLGTRHSQARVAAQLAVGAALLRTRRWQQASRILQALPVDRLDDLIQRLRGTTLDADAASRFAELAGQLSSGVATPARRAETLVSLPRIAAGAGLGTPAVTQLAGLAGRTADQITDDTLRCQAWSKIADTLAGYDDDAALRAITSAETAAEKMADNRLRQRALEGTISALAKAGHARRAERLASNFPAYERAQALATMTAAIAASDPALARHYAAEAEVLTDDIAAPEDQASALTLIGMAVAGVDATYAESLADKAQARVLSDEDYGPMICIALALAAVGAANSSIGIPADASPQYDFSNYARSLIRMGRLEQAKRVLLQYRDEAGLAEDLAWGLIRAGQWDEAEQVARDWPRACFISGVGATR